MCSTPKAAFSPTKAAILRPAIGRAYPRQRLADILSGYFFWGSRLHEAFNDDGTMKPEQLHLTGCPRFDFAAPRWRTLLDGEQRGYLLVNANFPLVNSRFSSKPGDERETMIRAGWDGGLYRSLSGRSETGLCQLSRRDRPACRGAAGSARSWCARIRSRAKKSIVRLWAGMPMSSSTARAASST